ncbi:MAG: hypothetical protein JRH15_21825 [Deltaproteobacteria bacterium]|nr:hypothetical protein [Deltaproteobacteria bacterium]
MRMRICGFFFILFLIAAVAGAETFTSSDLEGSWNGYIIEVDPTSGQIYWLFGDMALDGAGDVTGGSMTVPTGQTGNITDGSISLASDGSLSGSFATQAGIDYTIVDGVQDQNHTMFSFVTVNDNNALSLGLGYKQGGTYSQADMMGDWRFYGIEIDPALGVYWIMGDGILDAAGNLTSSTYVGPTGESMSSTGGQFALDQNGKITGGFQFEGPLNATVQDGTLDQGKSISTFVATNDQNQLDLVIGLKKGGAYTPSDLMGDWTFYNFMIDPVNERASWVNGNGSIDGNGSISGSYTDPFGNSISITSSKVTLNASGELSGTLTFAIGATETIQSGFMDRNKNVMIFVGTSDDGGMDLGIGFRRTDPPPTYNYTYYLPYFRGHTNHWTALGIKNLQRFVGATASVTVYSENGDILVADRKQLAAFGQDNFVVGAGEAEEGWIRIDSDHPLGGLCFFATTGTPDYMADMTFMDQLATKLHVPHVGQGPVYDTTVYVCNPNGTITSVQVRFIGQDGNILYTTGKQLPANGSWTYDLSSLVPDSSQANYGSLEIIGTQEIGAFALYSNVKNEGTSYAGIAAVSSPLD